MKIQVFSIIFPSPLPSPTERNNIPPPHTADAQLNIMGQVCFE